MGKVSEISAFLSDLENAYEHIWGVEKWASMVSGELKAASKAVQKFEKRLAKLKASLSKSSVKELKAVTKASREFSAAVAATASTGGETGNQSTLKAINARIENIAEFTLSGEQLVVAAVGVPAPGSWEFMGADHALELIAFYLNERYALIQEKAPRIFPEAIERKMEAKMLRNPAVSKYIKMLGKVGTTKEEVRLVMEIHLLQPLMQLAQHQDSGLITSANFGEDKG